MASPLTWILQLYDRVSGPAEKMSKAMGHFNKEIEKANERAAHRFVEELASKFAVTKLATDALEGGVELLIEKLGELGAEMLHSADYARTAGIIFESLAGSSTGGAELFENAEEYASKAGIKIKEAVEIFKALAKSTNLNQADATLTNLAQTAQDVALRTGESAVSIANSFAVIGTRNQLDSRAIHRLTEFGIPVDILAKNLGVTATNAEQLGKALEGHLPSGGKALQAIVASMQQLEGGQVGNLTRQVGEGFEGASNRLSNAWEKALASFAKTEGFTKILDLMDRMAKRLEDPAFGDGLSELATSFVEIADALERMIPSVKTLTSTLKVAGVLDLKGGESAGVQFGHDLSSGIKVGFTSDPTAIYGLWNEWFGELRGPRGADAHSPSRKMIGFGQDLTDGLRIGLGAGGLEDMLDVPSQVPRGVGTAPAATTSGHKLELHQEFNISAHEGMDLEALAQRIASLSVTSLQSPLESLALSMGAL